MTEDIKYFPPKDNILDTFGIEDRLAFKMELKELLIGAKYISDVVQLIYKRWKDEPEKLLAAYATLISSK